MVVVEGWAVAMVLMVGVLMRVRGLAEARGRC